MWFSSEVKIALLKCFYYINKQTEQEMNLNYPQMSVFCT